MQYVVKQKPAGSLYSVSICYCFHTMDHYNQVQKKIQHNLCHNLTDDSGDLFPEVITFFSELTNRREINTWTKLCEQIASRGWEEVIPAYKHILGDVFDDPSDSRKV